MSPDAFRTELCDSLTAFYEHPQESSFEGCARALARKFEAKTEHVPVPESSTDNAATDTAEEEHPEAPPPAPPQEAAAAPPYQPALQTPPRGGCHNACRKRVAAGGLHFCLDLNVLYLA
jgi:hypothetical protein